MREPSKGQIHLRRMMECLTSVEEALDRMEGRLQSMDCQLAFLEQALRDRIAEAGKDDSGQV